MNSQTSRWETLLLLIPNAGVLLHNTQVMAKLMMAMFSHVEQVSWDVTGLPWDQTFTTNAKTIQEKSGELSLLRLISRVREYSVDWILTKTRKSITPLLSLCLPILTEALPLLPMKLMELDSQQLLPTPKSSAHLHLVERSLHMLQH